MQGHFHLGLMHTFASVALTIILVGTVFRVFEVWGSQSSIPLIRKAAEALAVIY